ncbi:DNA repair exonuclease [Mesobacillus foraminis]|uniref:metallophosphoesterase family protein n=1 Tax=Mesobacillus foraminis TaxID=279826 RepID=UPI00399F3538
MKKVTFLHCADLHLDSPMTGLKHLPERIFKRLQESTFNSFTNIVNIAIKAEADIMIIAGDIFDGEDRSLRAQARFRKEMERLNDQGIPVYVIHGNHDHLGGKWPKLELPENVHVFASEVEMKQYVKEDGTIVNLYGFSYPKRHLTERWINQYQKFGEADFHIGLLHGNTDGASEHGNYAPFSLTELQDKQFDYWALGHIHKRKVLSNDPPAIYPGNPQGRNRKETGSKGAYLGELSEGGAQYEFIEANDVKWLELWIDAASSKSSSELYDLCIQSMDKVRSEGVGIVLTMEISGSGNLSKEAVELVESGELMDALQEEEKNKESFVWLRRLSFSDSAGISRTQLAAQGEFYEELCSKIDSFNGWDEALQPLYGHSLARRHLGEIPPEQKEGILREAEQILFALLLEKE